MTNPEDYLSREYGNDYLELPSSGTTVQSHRRRSGFWKAESKK
jgi:hypothetical protein